MPPSLDTLMYWIGQSAVVLMAAAGVLEAGRKRFDLFGTKAALVCGAPWLVASVMGLVTGGVGGILRDVLCNEEPLVFQGTLYATAAWAGSLALIGLLALGLDGRIAALLAGAGIFLRRVVAIRWEIGLSRFTAKGA